MELNDLPEVLPYRAAAKALDISLRTIMRLVASGKLLTSGFGKAKKIKKASLLALANEMSQPKPKLTVAEKSAKRSKSRSDAESGFVYRCATEFMPGKRAALVPVAVVMEKPTGPPLPPSMADNHPVGCRCIRHA